MLPREDTGASKVVVPTYLHPRLPLGRESKRRRVIQRALSLSCSPGSPPKPLSQMPCTRRNPPSILEPDAESRPE